MVPPDSHGGPSNGDTGLNRANDAVTNGGSSLDHATASNHPG
jgi:hypothetical protein